MSITLPWHKRPSGTSQAERASALARTAASAGAISEVLARSEAARGRLNERRAKNGFAATFELALHPHGGKK